MTGYAWRGDPGWLSPERIADLRARDPEPRPMPVPAKTETSRQLQAQFAQLRESGMTVGQAAGELHVSRKTGQRYERNRKGLTYR